MLSPLCPGSWHHIQNLDSFFTKISFVLSLAAMAWEGPLGWHCRPWKGGREGTAGFGLLGD